MNKKLRLTIARILRGRELRDIQRDTRQIIIKREKLKIR